MSAYIKVKTIDNTTTYLRKHLVAAVEQIPGTSRTEPYLKVYAGGFSYGIKMDLEEFIRLLEES